MRLRYLALALLTSVFAWSRPATSAPISITMSLRPETASVISSQSGEFVLSPTPLGELLGLTLAVDPQTRSSAYGPITYRSSGDTATVTSSFARFDFGGITTPYTSALLSFFDGHPPASEFSAVDVGVAYFDNDVGQDGSIGAIRAFRQLSFSQPENNRTRIISYMLNFELTAVDIFAGAGLVPPVDETTIATLLQQHAGRFTSLTEEVRSYLEEGCGPAGCVRSDATGYRFTWTAVPEPSTALLTTIGAIISLAVRRRRRRTARANRCAAATLAATSPAR